MITMPKFRAWLKPQEKMYHVVRIDFLQKFFIRADPKEDIIIGVRLEGEYHDIPVLSKYIDLMMFSTVFDKDSNEICQSDIVEIQLENGIFRSEVFYEDGCFWIRDWNHDHPDALLPLCDYATDLKIIGDVYQNSNMLEEGGW